MSSGRGSGGAAATTGAAAAVPIPTVYVKLVKRLKEIVANCTEAEIYAMLRECNMDPDEAAQRLLSQDTFHEVKSKREKKKEVKEPPEPRSRSVNSSSGRGNRSTADRGGRNSSSQSSTSEYGITRSKPSSKKENDTNSIPTSSILESTIATSNPTWRSTFPSNYASTETAMQAPSFPDGYSSSLQPSSGFQNNWVGKPGQVSMADIVKMGKSQGKPSTTLPTTNDWSYMGLNPAMFNHDLKQPSTEVLPHESEEKVHASEDMLQAIDMGHNLGTTEHLHITRDGWSLVDEQPMISMPETSVSKAFASPNFAYDGVNDHANNVEVQLPQENFNSRSLDLESKSLPVSDRKIEEEASGDISRLDDGLLENSNSHQSLRLMEHHEGSTQTEDASFEVSSAAADLRQLSLHEETSTKPTESIPAVIIPSHLRVTNADCAHLSFGSFNSGTYAGSFATKPLKNNLDAASVADDTSSMHQSDSRNHEHYDDGKIKPIVAENLNSRTGSSTENVDISSASQSEVLRSDALDATHELQYQIPSASFTFSSTSEPNAAAYTYLHGTEQMQNLSPLSSLMQQNSLQSSLLAPNLPALRDVDLQFSPLLAAQSLSAKYNTAVSSISGPTISMPEASKPSIFSNPQSTQNFASTAIPTGPTLPQHLAVHHYSQPALPLGHFANMLSYPFLPQSYTYLPSAAFQQAYSTNSPFHQSTASVPNAGMKYSLPQYKNSVSVTSLPQSANVASAYGGFGSSINMPGNFSLNPSTASASTTIGFDEALGMQYKEPSHYMPLQQNDWVHGTGSRTLSSLPANTFYSYQGQNQLAGFRQSQQPSQLGAVGYSDFYHSQAGASQQDHQPNPNEGNLGSSQTAPSQPAHQIWQHSY